MWRDDRIQAAIDTTTGFIAAKLAEKLKCPIYEMERLFLASKTYRLLCDPETGLYADNVLETADLFLREVVPVLCHDETLKPQSYFKYRSVTDPYTKIFFEAGTGIPPPRISTTRLTAISARITWIK